MISDIPLFPKVLDIVTFTVLSLSKGLCSRELCSVFYGSVMCMAEVSAHLQL